MNRAVWDEAGVQEDVRSYMVANLGDRGGVLVFDETGDIKQGTETAGVAWQLVEPGRGWAEASALWLTAEQQQRQELRIPLRPSRSSSRRS